MKTSKQIREWLEAQPWYELFRLNTHCGNSGNVEKILRGDYERGTIALSFWLGKY